MKRNKRENASSLPHLWREVSGRPASVLEPCTCGPLTRSMCSERVSAQAVKGLEEAQRLLVSPDLDHSLRVALGERVSERQPFSLLLLHVFQHEAVPLVAGQSVPQRTRYHVLPVILDQILTNVRRAIRLNDTMLIYARTGAAVLFPGVNQQGSQHILTRVYDSLDLLEGETLEPPLTRNTIIQLGIGTYPAPASSLTALLTQVGSVARSLELRPALTRQLHGVKPVPAALQLKPSEGSNDGQKTAIPYLELPETLPSHLTGLLPYTLARELCCAPVGRHHHMLTVALAEPDNREHIQRLQRVTGLTIFPVACNEQALKRLLMCKW